MANKWVEFIKSWAKKHNKSYGCALSDPQLKIDYRKAHPSKQQQKERETSERETMGMEDRDALEEEVLIVEPTKKKRKSTKKLEAKERETMAMEDELSYQTRERPKIGIFKEPKMLQYAIASKKSKLFNRELMKKLDEEMKKIDEEKKQIKEEMKKLDKEMKKIEEVEEKAPERKPIKGQVFISVIDRQALRNYFDRNYDAGDDELRIGVRAPNGNNYDENDFDNLTGASAMKTSSFKKYEPLAKKLEKLGLLEITRFKKS
jgi:hypothetical protein